MSLHVHSRPASPVLRPCPVEGQPSNTTPARQRWSANGPHLVQPRHPPVVADDQLDFAVNLAAQGPTAKAGCHPVPNVRNVVIFHLARAARLRFSRRLRVFGGNRRASKPPAPCSMSAQLLTRQIGLPPPHQVPAMMTQLVPSDTSKAVASRSRCDGRASRTARLRHPLDGPS